MVITAPKPGDLDMDGVVGVTDFLSLLGARGSMTLRETVGDTVASPPPADSVDRAAHRVLGDPRPARQRVSSRS